MTNTLAAMGFSPCSCGVPGKMELHRDPRNNMMIMQCHACEVQLAVRARGVTDVGAIFEQGSLVQLWNQMHYGRPSIEEILAEQVPLDPVQTGLALAERFVTAFEKLAPQVKA